MAKPDTVLPPPELSYVADPDPLHSAQVVRDSVALQRQRELNRHDRLENAAKWQQRFMLVFIAVVLASLVALGLGAGFVILLDDSGPHVDIAWHMLAILVDASIAATVGFFAVKTFER